MTAGNGLNAADRVFYVSTAGSDSWTGALAEPNKAKTDGPLATIKAARNAVRDIREKDGGIKTPVTVMLRGGSYCQEKTLVFTPEDSGTKDCPVTYQAYPGERPVVSGGRLIAGWKKPSTVDSRLWTAEVPWAAGEDGIKFNQLFINGERRIRARTPNKGEFFFARKPLPKPKDSRGFYFRKGEISADWENIEEASLILYHSWETSIHFISGVDTEISAVYIKPAPPFALGAWGVQRYYVENVFEVLDSPGEWYLNTKTGILYYYPVPGEDMAKAEVIAPVVKAILVDFKGDPTSGEFIDYVNFRGISFQHTNANISKRIVNSGQADINQNAMITARGLRNSVFEKCEMMHTGEHAVWLRTGCQDNRIVQCHVWDMGGGGVYVGEAASAANAVSATARNTVDNCFIHDGSYYFHGAHGIWVGRSSYNNFTHNEISNLDYSAFGVGWSWGFDQSTANHNIIDYNHIHHLSNGEGLSDMGGIYTLGVSPGTTERNNIIHDVYNFAPVSHGSGIYPDEGSSGILIENNIVYRVRTATLFQHYGADNIIRNNIFALGEATQLQRCREDVRCNYTAEGNIIYGDSKEMLGGIWKNNDWKVGKNLYWCTKGEPSFMGMDFNEWKAFGKDEGSMVADPLFVDAKNGDFRLKPNSPALKLGFVPIDTSKTGLYGDAEWVNLPRKYPDRKLNNVALPPTEPIFDDFEANAVGTGPSGAQVNGDDKGASVKVTDEAAAGGKKSLKVVDAPNKQFVYDPHIVYSPNFKPGKMKFSMDLKNSADMPASFYVEFRDWTKSEYLVGPTFWVYPDGKFSASGQDITTIPPGVWFHVEILFETGEDGSKEYNLKLSMPGEKDQVVDLPFINGEFAVLTWFGISSMSNEKTVFYMDNVKLEQLSITAEKEAKPEVKPAEKGQGAKEAPAEEKPAVEKPVKKDPPVVWWKLDDNGSTAKDNSGKNDAEVSALWAKGKFGACLYFDGDPAKVLRLADCADVQFGKDDFSIELWMSPGTFEIEADDKRRRFMEKIGFPEVWWCFDVLPDGKIKVEISDSNKVGLGGVSKASLVLNKWNHVAIVMDRVKFKLKVFLNGALDSVINVPRNFKGTLDVEGKDYVLGSAWQAYIGLIDDVKIFKRVLQDEEIKADYDKEKANRASAEYTAEE